MGDFPSPASEDEEHLTKLVYHREADFAGYTECYTCRRKYPWQEMDLGHYHHGRLDFDEMNTHPQCVRCNKWLHGNPGAYAERLVQDYGLKKVLDLRRRAQPIHKYTFAELLAIEEQLKAKLNGKVPHSTN